MSLLIERIVLISIIYDCVAKKLIFLVLIGFMISNEFALFNLATVSGFNASLTESINSSLSLDSLSHFVGLVLKLVCHARLGFVR